MTSDSSNANKSVVFADPPGTDHFIEAQVPIAQLNNDMMDVAFTKAVGCTQYHPGGCDGMRKDHRFADAVPLGENWRHKYLIDLDGMGYSARLFSLLASESAVLKTTVYTEFFSGKPQLRDARRRRQQLADHAFAYLRLDRAMAALYPYFARLPGDL
jgi:hypothetical protein